MSEQATMSEHWYLHTDGRIVRQPAATKSDVSTFLELARRIADTSDAEQTATALREAVLAIFESVRFNSLSQLADIERLVPVVSEVETYHTDAQWAAMVERGPSALDRRHCPAPLAAGQLDPTEQVIEA